MAPIMGAVREGMVAHREDLTVLRMGLSLVATLVEHTSTGDVSSDLPLESLGVYADLAALPVAMQCPLSAVDRASGAEGTDSVQVVRAGLGFLCSLADSGDPINHGRLMEHVGAVVDALGAHVRQWDVVRRGARLLCRLVTLPGGAACTAPHVGPVFHAALTCAVEGDADDDADGESQSDAATWAFRFLLRLRAELPECLGACLAVAREGVVSHRGAAKVVGFFIGYLMTLSSRPQCVDAVVEHMDLLWLALNLNPEWSAMDRVDMAVCCMKTLHNVAGARRQLPGWCVLSCV